MSVPSKIMLGSLFFGVFLAAAAVAYVVTTYLVQQGTGESGFEEEVSEIARQTRDLYYADHENAIEYSRELVDVTDVTSWNQIELNLAFAQSLYMTGNSANQQEAIDIASSIAVNEDAYPRARAFALNVLLGFAQISDTLYESESFAFAFPPAVYENLDPSEAAKTLIETTHASSDDYKVNRQTSLLMLAKLSNKLDPSSYASLYIAEWYSDMLLGSRVRTNVENLSRAATLSRISSLLADAEELRSADQSSVHALNAQANAVYHFRRGVVLGALATIGAEDGDSFEDAFYNAFLELENVEETNVFPDFGPFLHFTYAAYLHRLYGDDREEDVRYHLDSLTRILDANPDTETGDFRHFVKLVYERTQLDAADSIEDAAFMRNLTEVSSEFKTFLEDTGWSF